MYARTGTSYCCQNPTNFQQANSDITCNGNQVTFYEPLTGEPRICVLSSSGGSSSAASTACPVGFGCNLVGGTMTRCCGKDFGCPYNSAGFLNPHTGGHVQCTIGDEATCPEGFVCAQSTMFNGGVCCSETSSTINDACMGDTPLASPNPCSANNPCPNGYNCRNGRCCPSKGMCPVGQPLAGVTTCSAENPCPNNYQCITNDGQQFCCPAPEHVCHQPKDTGIICDMPQNSIVRYYFDEGTGSCRSFKYSQCGGNANNFDTLEQCEGFCVSSQCPQGRPYQSGASNAACSPLTPSTCPNGFTCMQPLFGSNHICCSSETLSCRESASAGTDCFGAALTILRYHYNSDTGRCESFQFYGCHGSSNNFFTRHECETTCQMNLKDICNGVSPLMNPSHQPQRCNPSMPCPAGNSCNLEGFCCPHSEYACRAAKNVGNTCTINRPGTFWFFDTMALECVPFTFSGCGGTPNRFTSKEACERICQNQMGECPKGMGIAEVFPGGGPQRCNLNLAATGNSGCRTSNADCVLSTSNTPICCISLAQCPVPSQAYIIPGSNSHVVCDPSDDTCPIGYECIRSATVAGFYMCCSSNPIYGNSINPRKAPVNRYLQAASPGKCPIGLDSNGQRCVVNAIGGCPRGYICLGAGSHGVCCRGLPKCTQPRHKPYYFSGKQVLICGEDQILCPDNTVCSESTIDGVDICCQTSSSTRYSHLSNSNLNVARCRDNHLPFFEIGHREPKMCDETSHINECPDDYECSRASDGQYYCCPSWEKCPKGASPFLVEGTRKPLGYGEEEMVQDCPNGAAYGNPYNHQKQICTPGMSTCPSGYICRKSLASHEHVCCTSESLNILERKFEGYCPPGQIPYMQPNTIEPSPCHMALSPCPTMAPYQCIYSAEKQNSYCCTLSGTANIPFTFHSRRQGIQMHPQQGGQQQQQQLQQMPPQNFPQKTMTISNNNLPSSSDNSQMFINGPNGEKIPKSMIPIQLLSAEKMLPAALPGAPVSGCPTQTQPLLNAESRQAHPCSTMSRCPDGFTCYSNFHDGRNAQCCTTMPSNEDDATFMRAMMPGKIREPIKVCPQGFIKLGSVCKRRIVQKSLFYVGQPGCSSDEQCQSMSNSTFCEKGYCRCPDRKLIHQSECVDSCPEGYVHIAGRCHDLTTIVFMDSVEDRANGTIGGYCGETVVAEEQCIVPNSYCNERSITCHCKPGFELQMNFEDKNDTVRNFA
uniref:BPTI/Kunitz inhibitor domain-containing protein n=1 Tax=Panagrolaimus superbus TaxID=310955 RepID=A0A914Z645_9BILA